MESKSITIEDAVKALSQHLLDRKWVSAIGIGEKDFHDVVQLYVQTKPNKETKELQKNGWMGFEVVVENIGAIKPAVSNQ